MTTTLSRYSLIIAAGLACAAAPAYAQTSTAAAKPTQSAKAPTPAADRAAVREAVLDYVNALYNVEPERIGRSVHPELAKRGYSLNKTTGEYVDMKMTFAQLETLAGKWNASRKLRKDAPKSIVVFEVLDKIATAKLTAEWGVDYFHLAKYDGKWKIVNVLWQSPPLK
jgi:hypothetical protein